MIIDLLYVQLISAGLIGLILIAYLYNSLPVLRVRVVVRLITNWLLMPVYRLLLLYHGSPNKLRKAIRKADRMAAKNNRRYRVYFLAGRYRVYNRGDIHNLRHGNLIRYGVNVTNMEQFEHYDTHPNLKKNGILNN